MCNIRKKSKTNVNLIGQNSKSNIQTGSVKPQDTKLHFNSKNFY